jgi:hypothetical protein
VREERVVNPNKTTAKTVGLVIYILLIRMVIARDISWFFLVGGGGATGQLLQGGSYISGTLSMLHRRIKK